MIGAVQTFGDLIHWHPHIHALVSEGVFLADGTLVRLPKLAAEPFLKLWEQEVFRLLLAEGKITEESPTSAPGGTPSSAWIRACAWKRETPRASNG